MPVGSKLVALRRERGKSISDVVSATKIMERMISALENERFDELPSPAYVRGYIRNYADFLGVPAAPLIEEYSRDIGELRQPQAPRPLPDRAVVPHRLDAHDIPRQAWLAAAAAVVVVALVAWGITALVGRDDTPTPIAPETTSTVDAPNDASGSDDGDEEPTQAPAGAFILAVEVVAGQSSWVQVRVDGLIAYEGTMPGGESKSWTITDSAVVRIGKPSAVTVRRDGQQVDIPPATDGIAEVSLSADSE